LAIHSAVHKHSTRASLARSRRAEARVSDLLLLEELHAHLPVGLLVNDAETLEILHANPPLPGLADPDLPHDQPVVSRDESRDLCAAAPELASRLQEVAATGRPQHLPEFRHESPGQEPRWWSVTLHRIDTDRWGRIVVTLAVDLTDHVRARSLLEEREAQQQTLRETIAAVAGHNLASSLQQFADALVLALPVDVVTLRLLDADGKLHLVAASGLRPAEKRRLALEPITEGRLETIIERNRHPLLESFGLHRVEVRWLKTRDDRIGTLTIGARCELPLPEADLALLDAAAAQLSNALATGKRRPRSLRRRSLEMARLTAGEDRAEQTRANRLRPRELAILRLYDEGLGTDQIAELLVLSPHTVRTHVRNARRRLGVSSRDEALDLLKATDPDCVI
jgi:DNA-binding CsgD family transcriptional regulator